MDRFDTAKRAIQAAGEILRRCRLEQGEIHQKSGHQDLVTYWDRRIEQLLRGEILSAFPRDSIVGEEYPPEDSPAGSVTWYLDPIDGTTNFINQHRNYAVSVGCWEGAEPLFGLVLDVERQELYWAKRGGGAWRDQAPIHVSDRDQIPDLLLTTPEILYTFGDQHSQHSGLVQLARQVRGMRSLGSVALELCQVAAGEADLFAALRSSPWDHNAARIILDEAGGVSCALSGEPLPLRGSSTVLAANSPRVLQEVQEHYLSLSSDQPHRLQVLSPETAPS